MKFYTHKTTSIFVIDVKFHKNPLFRLPDVQFFQTDVTNLCYRYNLLLADVICGDRSHQSSVADISKQQETSFVLKIQPLIF